ncbi:GMC oxidoreductase [Nonomuraea jiangxiensis]|uniref:GMC oxidoreductase n=1 Tax=Nonomuraea jiangxiensis TaxID=633440 RepID=UPI001C409897
MLLLEAGGEDTNENIKVPAGLRPRGCGRVTLASTDPEQPPLIDPRYVTNPEDVAALIRSLRSVIEIGDLEQLASYIARPYLPAGADLSVFDDKALVDMPALVAPILPGQHRGT